MIAIGRPVRLVMNVVEFTYAGVSGRHHLGKGSSRQLIVGVRIETVPSTEPTETTTQRLTPKSPLALGPAPFGSGSATLVIASETTCPEHHRHKHHGNLVSPKKGRP